LLDSWIVTSSEILGAGGDVDVGAPPQTPLAWAQKHRSIDGRAFSLDRFTPLKDLYEDDWQHICVIKPAQRGISEWAITYAAFALDVGAKLWAEKPGLNVAYVFPTAEALRDFSKERFSGLRKESAYLGSLFVDAVEFNGVTFKQIGDSYLYLRGGWSEAQLLSFPADVLILDEFDRMDPRTIALARRRLNASVIGRELDLSTPTIPGKGIHAVYLESDQRVYAQPCPKCSVENVYEFHRDVVVDGEPFDVYQRWTRNAVARGTASLRCPACKADLPDQARLAVGTWEAQEPEASRIHGYAIPPLAFPFASLQRLAVNAVADTPAEQLEFYRSDLGVPYTPEGAQITEAMVRQMASMPVPEGERSRITMGVDVGARFHVRVSADILGKRVVLFMGSVATWEELTNLLRLYSVRSCVIDALPELHAAEGWANLHPGRVLRAFYPTPLALPGMLFRVKALERIIQINRTMAMDSVYSTFAQQREVWPEQIANDPEVIAHFTAPTRVVTADEHGQETPHWVHSRPDHLFHAMVYDRVAMESLPKRAHEVLILGGVSRKLLT
jgi:hypothetical protein